MSLYIWGAIELKLRHLVASILMSFLRNYLPNFQIFRIIAYTTFILKITTLKNGLGRKLTLNLMKLRNNKRNIISAICSLWSKSGTAKCITSRPTFKSGAARAVPWHRFRRHCIQSKWKTRDWRWTHFNAKVKCVTVTLNWNSLHSPIVNGQLKITSYLEIACWRRMSRNSISHAQTSASVERICHNTSWPVCYVRRWIQAGTAEWHSRSSQWDQFCWAFEVWRTVYVFLVSVVWCTWTGSVLRRRSYVRTATRLPLRPPSARPTLAETHNIHKYTTSRQCSISTKSKWNHWNPERRFIFRKWRATQGRNIAGYTELGPPSLFLGTDHHFLMPSSPKLCLLKRYSSNFLGTH